VDKVSYEVTGPGHASKTESYSVAVARVNKLCAAGLRPGESVSLAAVATEATTTVQKEG